MKSVLPQKVSKFVETSLDSINSWFGKMKKRVDLNLKENARKKLQKLNAKIGEMFKENQNLKSKKNPDWEDQLSLFRGKKVPQRDF